MLHKIFPYTSYAGMHQWSNIFVNVKHMRSFESWVLKDPENHIWSKQFHVFPYFTWLYNLENNQVQFVGVIGKNETVWSLDQHFTGSLFVLFYNTETKTVKSPVSNLHKCLSAPNLLPMSTA